MDFNTPTRDNPGQILTTTKETGLFQRGRVNVVTPAEDMADGSYGVFYDSGAINPAVYDTAGANDEGSAFSLLAGFGNTDTNRFDDAQAVRSTVNDPILIGFYVANNGTVSLPGAGRTLASAVRDSQGLVTLTFTPSRANYRAFGLSAVSASARGAQIVSANGNSIQIKTTDETGAVEDCDFVLLALFSGNPDEAGECRDIVRVPQLFPELIIGRVSVSGGTPTIQVGGATSGIDFTVTDDGVGLYTITSVKTFGLNLLPVVCSENYRAQLMGTPTGSAFQVGVKTNAGVAQDDGFVFIVLAGDGTSDEQY